MAMKPKKAVTMDDLDPATQRRIAEAVVVGGPEAVPGGNPLLPNLNVTRTVDPNTEVQAANQMTDFLSKAAEFGVDPIRASAVFESGDPEKMALLESEMAAFREKSEAKSEATASVLSAMPSGEGSEITVNGSAAPGPITEQVTEAVAREKDASPILNPFQLGGIARGRIGKMEAAATKVENTAIQNSALLARLQESRRNRTNDIAGRLAAINEEQQADNRKLGSILNPLLAKKRGFEERAAQLRVGGRNLIQQIKGLFDSNWDPDKLEEKAGVLGETGQRVVGTYSLASGVRERDYDLIQREDKIAGALDAIAETEMTENLKSVSAEFAAVSTGLEVLRDAMGLNTQVAAAQNAARIELVATSEPAALQAMLASAKDNNGIAIVNGVEIPQRLITEQLQNLQQQDLAIRSAKNAIASQEMSLANQHTERLINLMTPEQLLAAKANGYIHNGVKLFPAAVEQGIVNGIQMRNEATATATMQPGAMDVGSQLGAFQQNQTRAISRLRTVFGPSLPGPITEMLNANARDLAKLTEGFQSANGKGKGQFSAMGATAMAMIDQMNKRVASTISSVGMSAAGGDKVGAEYFTRFMRGESFNKAEAFGFAKHFSEAGELPAGMAGSASVRSVFNSYNAAKEAVKRNPQWGKMDQNEKDQAIQAEFDSRVGKAAGNQQFDTFWGALPSIAKRVNHPFAGVSQGDWAKAMAGSLGPAAQQLSDLTGIPIGEATNILKLGKSNPKLTPQISQQIASTRMSAMMNLLDESPSAAAMKSSPSDALADFLNSEKMPMLTSNFATAQSHDFGGALTSQAVGGALMRTMSRNAQNISIANAQRNAARAGGTFTATGPYQFNGTYKANAVLSTIPGLTPPERQQLLDALKTQAQSEGSQFSRALGAMGPNKKALAGEEFGALERALMNTKFKDPNLERIRKIAAPKFRVSAESLDAAIDALGENK